MTNIKDRLLTATLGVFTLLFFAVLGLLVASNFQVAFTVFHTIFFPGKDNWIFDYRTDPIIGAMPQAFFMNCAILIVSSILLLTVALIVFALIKRKIKIK